MTTGVISKKYVSHYQKKSRKKKKVKARFTGIFYIIGKRIFDVVASLIISVLILSWLIPLLAVLIKLDSKGPVFFVQTRIGFLGIPFRCYKLRTMVVNQNSDSQQAMYNDQRITRIGHFLRISSLDELPQFFNVLIGNMSIVGPRPHMISHTVEYSRLTEKFKARHSLKPGITGWAQICGLRGEVTNNEAMLKRVDADMWYLKNWSFLLDVKIILLTFW